jgi:hypothetical protein
MADKVNVSVKFPLGLGGILFLIFMILKLTGHIGWSWWWVTSPLWIPVALVLLILLIGFLAMFIGK